jgi:hypothetical protein
MATDALTIQSSARLLANGAGGGGGGGDDNTGRVGGRGGNGGGGGILLHAKSMNVQTTGNQISARGGGGSLTNGGTVKLFYGSFGGQKPAAAGRVFDAGPGSFSP